MGEKIIIKSIAYVILACNYGEFLGDDSRYSEESNYSSSHEEISLYSDELEEINSASEQPITGSVSFKLAGATIHNSPSGPIKLSYKLLSDYYLEYGKSKDKNTIFVLKIFCKILAIEGYLARFTMNSFTAQDLLQIFKSEDLIKQSNQVYDNAKHDDNSYGSDKYNDSLVIRKIHEAFSAMSKSDFPIIIKQTVQGKPNTYSIQPKNLIYFETN